VPAVSKAVEAITEGDKSAQFWREPLGDKRLLSTYGTPPSPSCEVESALGDAGARATAESASPYRKALEDVCSDGSTSGNAERDPETQGCWKLIG